MGLLIFDFDIPWSLIAAKAYEQPEPQPGDDDVNWFFAMVRVLGSAFPLTSAVVRIQDEIDRADSREVQRRLDDIEDPISALHPEVREVSRSIYEKLSATDANKLTFEPDFIDRHRRVLAILEGRGLIEATHTIGAGGQFYGGELWVKSPTYLLYLASLYEDPELMDQLVERVDTCAPGHWLDGRKIAEDIPLPIPVIKAVFDAYEAQGLGLCSRTVGAVQYNARA
jgi:hypothetical protein